MFLARVAAQHAPQRPKRSVGPIKGCTALSRRRQQRSSARKFKQFPGLFTPPTRNMADPYSAYPRLCVRYGGDSMNAES